MQLGPDMAWRGKGWMRSTLGFWLCCDRPLQIKKTGTNKCLDVVGVDSNLGTDLVVHDCHTGDNQLFGFTPFEDGYRMRPKSSRMCIDVDGHKPDNGAQLHQWECLNAPNQKYKLVAGELRLMPGVSASPGGA